MLDDRPLKVHLFHDNSKERSGGKPWMKDIYCRGNSGNSITNDPKKVTCLRCLRRMEDNYNKVPGAFSYQMADEMSQTIRELEAEIEKRAEDAARLADVLKYVAGYVEEDRRHAIAVVGTQITVGQIVAGALLLHEQAESELKRTD